LTPLSAHLGATPFDIEMTVRLQPKRAFGINRNGRSTSPKYAPHFRPQVFDIMRRAAQLERYEMVELNGAERLPL
jgi:hypothetical protein